MPAEKKNIFLYITGGFAMAVTIFSSVFFFGGFYNQTNAANTSVAKVAERQQLHEERDNNFKADALVQIGIMKGALEQLEKTINGGVVIEHKNGKRTIIWKDESAK